jgi:hypothetical protein
VGSSDVQIQQLAGLLNEEGRDLSARYGWEGLIREATFQTQAQEDQGALTTIIGAANAYRYILNDTMWNRSRREPICGPKSSLDWQVMKAMGTTGPFTEYRIRGGHLLFIGAPVANETVAFEYVTKNWCTSQDGNAQRRAVSRDDDEVLLDDELVLAGLEWRWLKAKRLEYTEEFNAYERRVLDAMTRDGTKRAVSLAAGSDTDERRVYAPPGSWNL